MQSFCFARDACGKHRKVHKPCAGKYDGQPIVTCVWCGKTLTADTTTTSEICGVQDHGCAAQLVGGLRTLPDAIQCYLRSHLRKEEAERACVAVRAAVEGWNEMHEMFHAGLSDEERAEFGLTARTHDV